MLEINPLLVCELISRARAFHTKEMIEVNEDWSNGSNDRVVSTLIIEGAEGEEEDEEKEDPIYDEITSVIEDLEPDQQTQLVAILWIRREDYTADERLTAFDEAKRSATPFTAKYLLSKPQVADFLENGLNQLGYFCNEE